MNEKNQNQIMIKSENFLAHVDAETKRIQYLGTHLENVSYLSVKNCPLNILENMAALAAFLHDAGKLGEFQEYMEEILEHGGSTKHRHIDHASAGGWIIENITKHAFVSKMVGTAIYSHHGLLDCIDLESGESISEKRRKKEINFSDIEERYFQICDKKKLIALAKKAHEDCKDLYENVKKTVEGSGVKGKYGSIEFYWGMYERLLLSLLIDSDWSDAASFAEEMELAERISKEQIQKIWEEAILSLEAHMKEIGDSAKNQSPLNIQRREISKLCYHASGEAKKRYRLTVPTGAGKTFSSLRFALYHAKKFEKQHIIYVAPYNSILEQNATDIRIAVGNEQYVLEHHCNVLHEDQTKEDVYKKVTENWDSPIIATTAVQMLNTLFSGQKSSIRRMNHLCNSVIIFDEIQAIPIRCTELFHLAVNFLTEFCNTTVVLCSATQPSLAELKENNIMRCEEMTGDPNGYTEVFRRVTIEDKTGIVKGGMQIEDLRSFILQAFREYETVLVIVNTKQTARDTYMALREAMDQECELYHLSTNMCPQNRKEELDAVQKALKDKKRTICVSTQLIEAGVNISFGCVIRSLAGLDSIIQAAGRCNRHKEMDNPGKVYIVKMVQEAEHIEKLYEMRNAQAACERLLCEFKQNPEAFDYTLDSQFAIKRFYKLYYYELGENETKYPSSIEGTSLVELLGKNDIGRMQYARRHGGKMPKHPLNQAFKTAGEEFKVISEDSNLSIVILYDQTAEDLIKELENSRGVSEQKKIMRKLQRYTVGISPYMKEKINHAVYSVGSMGVLVLNMDYYDKKIGVTETSQNRFLNF